MPKVETVIVPTYDFWGGVGEPTICVVAPAVLNAIHAATGKPDAHAAAAQSGGGAGQGMTAAHDSGSARRRRAAWRTAAAMAPLVAAGAAAALPALLVVDDGIPRAAGRRRRRCGARTRRCSSRASPPTACSAMRCRTPPCAFPANVGPSLAGIGARLTRGAVAAADRRHHCALNPATVMPSYYRIAGLDRVAAPYAGKPILTAAEVEDVVAYLSTLR